MYPTVQVRIPLIWDIGLFLKTLVTTFNTSFILYYYRSVHIYTPNLMIFWNPFSYHQLNLVSFIVAVGFLFVTNTGLWVYWAYCKVCHGVYNKVCHEVYYRVEEYTAVITTKNVILETFSVHLLHSHNSIGHQCNPQWKPSKFQDYIAFK